MPEQFILANMSDKLIFFHKNNISKQKSQTYIYGTLYSTPSWYNNEQKVSWPHELLSPELFNEDRLLPDTYSGLKKEK